MLLSVLIGLVSTAAPGEERAPTLKLGVTGVSGAVIMEVGPVARGLGVGAGARVSLTYGLTERLELGPALDLRRDFGNDRTDVFGSARLLTRFANVFTISSSIGYGMTLSSAPVPQQFFVIGAGVGVRGGRCWFTLETEVVYRIVVTGSRTIRLLGAVTFEHDVLG